MKRPTLTVIPGEAGELTPEAGAAFQAALDLLFAQHPQAAALFRQAWRDQAASRTRSTDSWRFLQVDPEIARGVSEWIDNEAVRKRETRQVWNLILCHIDRRDGRVLLDRSQIAEELGLLPRNVSTCLAQLVKIGALLRIQLGRNAAHRLNPHIGTKLGRQAGHQARQGTTRPRLAAADGVAVEERDPRQSDLEDAIAEQMRRSGKLPWDMPR